MPAEQPSLALLQNKLKDLGIQGFIVPSGDEYLGEYVPDSARRLEWLTGFTGSAGFAVVLRDRAAFFTDGRYVLQAEKEVPQYERFNQADKTPEKWLAETAAEGAVIGYDPCLHTPSVLKRFQEAAGKLRFEPIEDNPIDALWQNRPPVPASPVRLHEEKLAGKTSAEKRAEIGKAIAARQAEVAVLVLSDSVNWLLNIRASDLEYSPLLLAYALIFADGKVTLYVDERRVDTNVRAQLGADVTLRPPSQMEKDLEALAAAQARVLIDPVNTPVWFTQTLSGATIIEGDDPCQLPKATKNVAELEGIRDAHRRDGLALTRLLHWLSLPASLKKLNEISLAEKLLSFRREDETFQGSSFATIAGFGPNGAIVHYRATAQSSRTIAPNGLLLLDSGGQYPSGTTDVTRTMAIGAPTAQQKKHFTLVLKGHIALATARFPKGTSGTQLDALARRPLWQEGLDYDHGTGHGVGMFLNVHEGPQRISKRAGHVALVHGMILSNEPGYYLAGQYGIRLENLVAVTEGKTGWLEFETLTLTPFDVALIDAALLDDNERAWLNSYHARVEAAHLEKMDAAGQRWLKQVCAPV